MSKILILNRVLCLLCDDLIISKHGHDFVMCSCGSVGVDGGNNYQRRIGEDYNMIDLSIYSDKFEDFREYLRWGKNYDENMVYLDQTEWVPIKDMTTGHIQAILDGNHSRYNPFYNDLFKKELKYRKNDKRNKKSII